MQQRLNEIEERFLAELHLLSLDKRSLDALLPEYDRLEAETAEKLRELGAEDVITALQRRLVVARISAAHRKHADIETAVALFNRSIQLGYDTPGEELVTTAMFAQICLRNGRADLAVLQFEEALQKATKLPETEQASLFEELLAQLRSSASLRKS